MPGNHQGYGPIGFPPSWTAGPPDPPVEYCDYCEDEGHTFRNCPARDDDPGYDEEIDPDE